MWGGLLVLHAIVALLLLGALTHQAASLLWPAIGKRSFMDSYRTTRVAIYTNAVVVLFLTTLVLGSIVYAHYRYTVRPVLEDLNRLPIVGLFELKEHFVALMLGVLPAYWYLWKRASLTEHRFTRALLTLLLTATVWFAWVAGHLVNNARGLQ